MEQKRSNEVEGLVSKMKKYGEVSWCWKDIRNIRPKWSKKKCEEFLERHDPKLSQSQVEQGWHYIELALVDYE